jgi:hypothetical protein
MMPINARTVICRNEAFDDPEVPDEPELVELPDELPFYELLFTEKEGKHTPDTKTFPLKAVLLAPTA